MKEKIKKVFIVAQITFVFTLPLVLRAQVIITEVMYDLKGADTGREWIEVKNIGTNAVDLSTWKFFEANTNHKINALASPNLLAGAFAVIADDPAKFVVDNPGFAGLLFGSVFSLSNSGETIILRDENLSDIDSVAYSPSIGGQGDGMSLQKTVSGWIVANPTPGQETDANAHGIIMASTTNTTVSATGDTVNTTDTTREQAVYSSHSNQSVASVSYDPSELEVTAGRPRLGFVGAPLSFEAKTKSTKNIPSGNAVSSLWSMGDGTQKTGQFISHAYEFPGEYIVILNSQSGGASAVSKVKVKVIEPKTEINSASAEYIEIHNRDVYELNLGGFILETYGGRFIIPVDTIVPAHLSVKLPASVTKLSVLKEFVRIANPRGKILTTKPIDSSALINMAGNPLILLPEGMSEKEFIRKLTETFKK